MNQNTFRIALAVVVAIWSINVFAADKNQPQALVHLESYQLSPSALEDNVPAKVFEKTWENVGKELGYPKVSASDRNDSAHKNIKMEYFDSSWVSADWQMWTDYDRKLKFFLAGIFTKHKDGANRKLTPEDFKSITLGYYQCVNALTDVQTLVRNNHMDISGTVEDTFRNCGMARI